MPLLQVLSNIGAFLGLTYSALVVVYLIPGSPLRRLVDEWIRGRLSVQFDKELASYRHRLDLNAEAVRADHRRLLHNSQLVTERRHEVIRELYRLFTIAQGRVGAFGGTSIGSNYRDIEEEHLKLLLPSLEPSPVLQQQLLEKWKHDRQAGAIQIEALDRFNRLRRAEASLDEARNYFYLHALYLDDETGVAVETLTRPLIEILSFANFPEPGRGVELLGKRNTSTKHLEELKKLLRDRLLHPDGSSPDDVTQSEP